MITVQFDTNMYHFVLEYVTITEQQKIRELKNSPKSKT